MDSKETGRNLEPENTTESKEENKDFNAGGNDSDYDGGHPKDAYSGSEGRIEAGEEQSDSAENSSGGTEDDSFNAGGNDSDYDGGHPKDVSPDSPGHIDSSKDNPGNTQK